MRRGDIWAVFFVVNKLDAVILSRALHISITLLLGVPNNRRGRSIGDSKNQEQNPLEHYKKPRTRPLATEILLLGMFITMIVFCRGWGFILERWVISP